jgi:hypothetical protein
VSFRRYPKGWAFARNADDTCFVISNRIYPREKSLMKSASGISFIRMLKKTTTLINGYKKSGVFDFRRDFSSSPRRAKSLGFVGTTLQLGESSK